MRGAPCVESEKFKQFGITPAYAGSTEPVNREYYRHGITPAYAGSTGYASGDNGVG